MKEFTDEELVTMAFSEIKKMDTHLWSQIIISVFLIAQSVLLFFSLVSIGLFAVLWVLFMGLYLFHNKKSKKSEIKLREILDELTSREI